MAKKKSPVSALDKLYAQMTKARKASRGKISWRQSAAACATEGGGKHPCYTEYVTRGGKRVRVKTSRTASFGMPKRLASLAHLRGARGVVLPRALGKKMRFKSKGRRRSVGDALARANARGRASLFAAARRISTGR
jgi:hypothetical protein